MLVYTVLFLGLALLLPSQDAHRSSPAGRSFRGRAFRSGGPNYWHFRWGGPSWPRRKAGGGNPSFTAYSFGGGNGLETGSQRGNGLGTGSQQPRPRAPDPLWSEVVPARLRAAPAETARLSWPPAGDVGLNGTALTGWMEQRPEVRWNAAGGRRGERYTVLIVDEGIERLAGKQGRNSTDFFFATECFLYDLSHVMFGVLRHA